MFRAVAAVFTFLILASGPAFAAKAPAAKKPAPAEPPMQVQLVRSAAANCEPNCPEWIAAQGKIESGTLKQFRKVLGQLGDRKVPVFLYSGGGSVHEAFAIGRLLRSKGLDISVTRTEFVPCPATDTACLKAERKGPKRGLPRPTSACASSCAFVLAAGVQRFVSPWSMVGVHQIKSLQIYTKVLRTYQMTAQRDSNGSVKVRKTLVSEKKLSQTTVEKKTTDGAYNEIKKYFVEMGISEQIMPILLSTPHTSVHWMSQAELRTTRLATSSIDSSQIVRNPATPAPETATPGQSGILQIFPMLGIQ